MGRSSPGFYQPPGRRCRTESTWQFFEVISHCGLFFEEVCVLKMLNCANYQTTDKKSPYHMTMATILSTASFRLWQKLTRALPFGPILPSMMPADKGRVAVTQVLLLVKAIIFSLLHKLSQYSYKYQDNHCLSVWFLH